MVRTAERRLTVGARAPKGGRRRFDAERSDTLRVAAAMLLMGALVPMFPFLAYDTPTSALALVPWLGFSGVCAVLGALAIGTAMRLKPLELTSGSLLLPGRVIGGALPPQRDGRFRVSWKSIDQITLSESSLQVHTLDGQSVVVLRSRFRRKWAALTTAIEAESKRRKHPFVRSP